MDDIRTDASLGNHNLISLPDVRHKRITHVLKQVFQLPHWSISLNIYIPVLRNILPHYYFDLSRVQMIILKELASGWYHLMTVIGWNIPFKMQQGVASQSCHHAHSCSALQCDFFPSVTIGLLLFLLTSLSVWHHRDSWEWASDCVHVLAAELNICPRWSWPRPSFCICLSFRAFGASPLNGP